MHELTEQDFDGLPRVVYGMKMPTSAALQSADRKRALKAKAASEAMAAALRQYHERRAPHG